MRTSLVCDRCGKDPAPFECGNDDASQEEVGFYHIIPRRCDDPVTLMSSGELVFKIAVTKEHPILEDEAHICADCFDEIFGDPTFENEDEVNEQ